MNVSKLPEFDARNLREHKAANLFPLMDDEALRDLAENIQENGQQESVVVMRVDSEYLLLDGRNRVQACRSLGRAPRYVILEISDPFAFVLSANLHRRHLNESQRAIVAGRWATMRQGARTDLPQNCGKSQQQAAAQLNVSPRSVQYAHTILNSGRADLLHEVEAGRIRVSAAAKLAGRPELLAEIPSGATEQLADRSRKMSRIIQLETKARRGESAPIPRPQPLPEDAMKAEVVRMHNEGKSTRAIAKDLRVRSTNVSTIKAELGITKTGDRKLWGDIEHLATSLDGTKLHIDKLTETLNGGAQVNTDGKDIDQCCKKLVKTATAIRRLATAIRLRHAKA